MKTRFISLSIALYLLTALAWAQNPTVVSTDAEIRAAIQVDNANIQLGADIDLSNSTLSIPSNHMVTMDLNGHNHGNYLVMTHRTAPTQNPNCQGIYSFDADRYTRSTQPSSNEINAREAQHS